MHSTRNSRISIKKTTVFLDPKKNLSHLTFEERSRAAQLDMVVITNLPKFDDEFSKTHKSEKTKDNAALAIQSPNLNINTEEASSAFLKIAHRKLMIPMANSSENAAQQNYKASVVAQSAIQEDAAPITPSCKNASNSDFLNMNLNEIRDYMAKYDYFREKLDADGAVKSDYQLILKKVFGKVIRDMPEGTTFGERGLQGSLIRTASVVAKTCCDTIVLPLKKFAIALKAAAKERSTRKMRLLHQAIPESIAYTYEQYFQFQYHFEDKSTIKDTDIIAAGDPTARPCIIAAGECLVLMHNTAASRHAMLAIIDKLEMSLRHDMLAETLRQMHDVISKLKTPEFHVGYIGAGELAGIEILVPEIGQSLFTYRAVSSTTEYIRIIGDLGNSAQVQVCSTLLSKLKHRVNMILHNSKAAKISRKDKDESQSHTIVEELDLPLGTKRANIKISKNLKVQPRKSSFKIGSDASAEKELDRCKSSYQGLYIPAKKYDHSKDNMIDNIKRVSQNEQNKLDLLRKRDDISNFKKTILEQDDEMSRNY